MPPAFKARASQLKGLEDDELAFKAAVVEHPEPPRRTKQAI